LVSKQHVAMNSRLVLAAIATVPVGGIGYWLVLSPIPRLRLLEGEH
jgi:hypothetical protein